jgi:hypothetical protein
MGSTGSVKDLDNNAAYPIKGDKKPVNSGRVSPNGLRSL